MSNGFAINSDNYNIVQIGLGGTGSRLLQMASTLYYSFSNSSVGKKNLQITIVDGDVYEQKNMFNQPCIPGDIGKSKAEVLARRYQMPSGIPINYVNRFLTNKSDVTSLLKQYGNYINVIITCVDNDESRCMIHEVFKSQKNLIWIDAGNEKASGQVVMGVRANGCTYLPSVVDLYPTILEKTTKLYNGEGCSRGLPADVRKISQNLITNVTSATLCLNYLSLLFSGEQIGVYEVNFNTANLHCVPRFIDKAVISA